MRKTLLILGIVFLLCVGGAIALMTRQAGSNTQRAESEFAASSRDLWKQVKPLAVGTESASIGLDQLRRNLQYDSAAVRAALGDDEFAALQEKIEVDDEHKQKVADLEKQMANAKSELDSLASELKESTKRLEKLDEVLPAMKAFQEGRRLAPEGSYQIELKIKKSLTESEELNAAVLRTRLECLRTDKHTEDAGSSIYVFGNVSKSYGEEIQKRFQSFNATVTVSEQAR